MQVDPPSRPNRIPWPPIVLVAAVAAAVLVHFRLFLPPIPFAETLALRAVGWVLIAAGLGLGVWARETFKHLNTTILPHRGATALATTGPFRFSRNPIYLGEVLALIGIGLVLNALPFLLIVPVFMFAVDRLAIRREERHLLDRFGDAWVDYADSVRRWL